MPCRQSFCVLVSIVATLVSLMVFMVVPGQAASVQLSWTAPITNADSTPLAGYKLYYGETSVVVSGLYQFSIDVGNQTTYTLSGLQEGTLYYFSVTAYDTSANESDYSNEVSAIPSPEAVVASGLVAAYSFDEGSGTTVADRSGYANTGTISGAIWSNQGKFGSALSFDGADDWVTVADSPSLDLTTGMTLEAWVYPTANTGWRTVVLKEQMDYLVYGLFASSDTNQPAVEVCIGGCVTVTGPSPLPLNTWTHLATTYDGSLVGLYVNGIQVASRMTSGSLLTSTNPLRIGGDSLWGDYFQGRIDEVRIYNRALTATEIQADMTIGVTPPPVGAPTAAFSGTPTSGPVPLSVAFSDASTGGITAWAWTFGDGTTSTAQHPSHSYKTAGTYTVSLTVTGPGGTDTEVKTNYIRVNRR